MDFSSGSSFIFCSNKFLGEFLAPNLRIPSEKKVVHLYGSTRPQPDDARDERGSTFWRKHLLIDGALDLFKSRRTVLMFFCNMFC